MRIRLGKKKKREISNMIKVRKMKRRKTRKRRESREIMTYENKQK